MGHSKFFSEFGQPFQQPGQQPPSDELQDYYHNTFVLEIENNFPFAQWLMHRYVQGLIKQVDQIEKNWLDFLLGNNINILEFKKGEQKKFTEKYFRHNIIKEGFNWDDKPIKKE